MSKRFTETDKWNNKWFRHLTATQKFLYLYLNDKCDLAGFLEIDEEHFSYETGIGKDKILGAIQGLNRGCLVADGWLFLTDFLRDQKNERLNLDNNAHKHIITRFESQVKRFSSIPEFDEILGAAMGLRSPIGKGNGKGNGKQGGVGGNEKVDIYPFDEFWKTFDKSVAKKKIEVKWANISDSKKLLIKEHLPKYVASTPDKSKRKNPETYLNSEGWRDEIIEPFSQNGNGQLPSSKRLPAM